MHYQVFFIFIFVFYRVQKPTWLAKKKRRRWAEEEKDTRMHARM